MCNIVVLCVKDSWNKRGLQGRGEELKDEYYGGNSTRTRTSEYVGGVGKVDLMDDHW